MNEYYISAITDVGFIGYYCKIDFEINSLESIEKIKNMLKEEGKANPVILFYDKLNK